MNQMKIVLVLGLLTLLPVCPGYAAKDTLPSREEIIDNELQKASGWAQHQNESQTQEKWQEMEDQLDKDLAELKDKFQSEDDLQDKITFVEPSQVRQDMQKRFGEENTTVIGRGKAPSYDFYTKENIDDLKEREKELQGPHYFELAPEMYMYKYTEDSLGVKTEGVKGGMAGVYQYRMAHNRDLWTWNDYPGMPNIFRLEGRATYGEVDYEGSGTWGGIPDWNFEARGLLGMEIPVNSSLMFTPYAGFGYRYLYNDFSKYPAGLVDGQAFYSGYDRESNYAYIPLGLEAKAKFAQTWSLAMKGEFDLFLWGKQVSHLEDMVDGSDVNAGYDELENSQDDGMGWRVSLRLTKEFEKVDIFAEPFFRYWHIEDSDISNVTSSGVPSGSGMEPENETWEYGLSLGAAF